MFGLLRDVSDGLAILAVAALTQGLAIASLALGRRTCSDALSAASADASGRSQAVLEPCLD